MNDQLKEGEEAEQRLDCYFSEWYHVLPVNRDQQRQGIDRIWRRKNDGREYTVEYKTDFITTTTRNVFIETMSVDISGKLGWAYTSKAQLLVYYVPQDEAAYIVEMTMVKRLLPEWSKAYRIVSVPNGDDDEVSYYTKGILVPLDDFKRECQPIIRRVSSGQ